jgi:endonuclease/exonuclease/phosphatase family metal-dependent hydrolase
MGFSLAPGHAIFDLPPRWVPVSLQWFLDMGKRAAPNHQPGGEVPAQLPLITLATWNIRGFARPDVVDLAAVLQSQIHRADTSNGSTIVPGTTKMKTARAQPLEVAVVQELQRVQAKRLAQLLGMQHVWSFKHSPLGPLVRFAEGLALFSVYPLSHLETLDLTPRIQRFRHRRRIAQFAYIRQIDADVVNIHLASHGNSSARIDQLRLVLDRVQARGAPRCIVAGDFNAAHEPELYGLLERAGFSDVWLIQNTASTSSGFTNPAGAAKSRLDRIFVQGLTVNSVDVPPDHEQWVKRSDHLPVFACLEPEPNAAVPSPPTQP